jgi:mono/diheme cytochrome c family protein
MRVNISTKAAGLFGLVGAPVVLAVTCVTTVMQSGVMRGPPKGDRPTPQYSAVTAVVAEAPANAPDDNVHADAADARNGDAMSGRASFELACAACHGAGGQGMPHQGPSLLDSAFVAGSSDTALTAFVKTGRLPTDPRSVMKLMMPPRGGNPTLSDADIAAIVRHMRSLQADARASAAATTASAMTAQPGS